MSGQRFKRLEIALVQMRENQSLGRLACELHHLSQKVRDVNSVWEVDQEGVIAHGNPATVSRSVPVRRSRRVDPRGNFFNVR